MMIEADQYLTAPLQKPVAHGSHRCISLSSVPSKPCTSSPACSRWLLGRPALKSSARSSVAHSGLWYLCDAGSAGFLADDDERLASDSGLVRVRLRARVRVRARARARVRVEIRAPRR